MAWLPNDLQLSGRGKERPNSAISLKSLSSKVCKEKLLIKITRTKKGRRRGVEGSMEETSDT